MHLKGNFFCIIPHRFLQRDNIKYQATSSCIPAHNRQDTYLDRLTSTSVPVLLGPVSGASFIFSIPISTTGFLGSEITLKLPFCELFNKKKLFCVHLNTYFHTTEKEHMANCELPNE